MMLKGADKDKVAILNKMIDDLRAGLSKFSPPTPPQKPERPLLEVRDKTVLKFDTEEIDLRGEVIDFLENKGYHCTFQGTEDDDYDGYPTVICSSFSTVNQEDYEVKMGVFRREMEAYKPLEEEYNLAVKRYNDNDKPLIDHMNYTIAVLKKEINTILSRNNCVQVVVSMGSP